MPLVSQASISFPDRIDTKQESIDVQIVLNKVLNPSPYLTTDGVFGRKTIQAVKDFQLSQGLVPDGKVGFITRTTLEKVYANNLNTPVANTTPTTLVTVPVVNIPNTGGSSLGSSSSGNNTSVSSSSGGGSSSGGSSSGSTVPKVESNIIADIIKPTVSIINPLNDSNVSGTITITAIAGDNIGISKVDFYKDNEIIPFSTTTSVHTTSLNTLNLTNGIHTFKAVAYDQAGNTTTSSIITTTVSNVVVTLLPALNPSNTVQGLDYKYYEATSYTVLPNFITLTPVKMGTTTNFDITLANKLEAFSFNFTGYVTVPTDGDYTFYTSSDDGSRVYIDDVLVVNNDGLHGPTEKSGVIGLKSGKHSISVQYFNQLGGKTLNVKYAGPNIIKQNIPISYLSRVDILDTTKPIISSFSIPETSSSLTITTSFVATDAIGLTGYTITESSSIPSSFSSTKPITYTFSSTGFKTLYAWVKDAAGNVSLPFSDTVTINTVVIPTPIQNIYYISPSGNDVTGNGTLTNPWATLYKACNSVTTAGTTIHVKAGTYIETLACNLSVGVSIEGEGNTSVIKSHYTTPNNLTMTTASISLVSSASGSTNGNQSISNLKLDGDNLQGSAGILVKKRSNVKVHDVTIVDFFKNGIAFWGPSAFSTGTGPFVYDDGNELYDSVITNCGDIPGDNVNYSGGGLILMTAQSNMLIHDNILTEMSRAQGHNGNIINAGGRHFKNIKYYNNKSYKPDNEGGDLNPIGSTSRPLPQGWNFHLEIWHVEGGFEIYNNEFHGGSCAIDIGGEYAKKGDSSYSYSIHDNLFTTISGHGGSPSYHGSDAITVEAFYTEDVFIYDNHFLNFPITIEIGDEPTHYCEMKRVYIYNNLMENTGYGNGIFSSVIAVQVERVGNITSDIYIHNNTIMSDVTSRTMAFAIQVGNAGIPGGGTLNNLNIKNNILVNHTNGAPIYVTNNGSINGFHIENNLSYNLNNYNIAPYFRPNNIGTLTNYTYLNNIPTTNTTQQNPLFVSSTNFHLQSTSPAINAGTNVDLPYNGSAPDIGVFEY